MVTKYGIYHQFDMGEGLAYNFFFFIYLLVICYFVLWIYLVPDNLTLYFDIHIMDI